MLFNLKKPCTDCPFRKDSAAGWLGYDRTKDISNTLVSGNGTFSCHKTTGAISGRKVKQEKQSHCYGALQMLRNMECLESGFIFQMAERLLGADFSSIKFDTSIVFENHIQFIEHHDNSNSN